MSTASLLACLGGRALAALQQRTRHQQPAEQQRQAATHDAGTSEYLNGLRPTTDGDHPAVTSPRQNRHHPASVVYTA